MSLIETLPRTGNDFPEGTTRTGKGIRWKTVFSISLSLGLAVFLGEAFRVLVGTNFHAVIPGQVYRSAQPSPQNLKELVQSHGIRTVLNLRGCCSSQEWYRAESQATCDLDICQEDFNFSAGRLPATTELKRLIEVLDRAEYPVLLHCRRGSDRTGLVSTLILLLRENVSMDQALGQLHWRFGHISFGRTEHMGEFFGLYRNWLEQHNHQHSPRNFRYWVLQEYRGGNGRCEFEEVQLPKQPIPLNQPVTARVKLRNTSAQTWQFSPMQNAGVHLIYVLYDSEGKEVSSGRAGLFDKDISPGQSVELILPIHSVPRSGTYQLFLSMIDEQMAGFYQLGSEPYEMRLEFGE